MNLTREQILALVPGPALDAAVAEHVFGKTVFQNRDGEYRYRAPSAGQLSLSIPAYSTTGGGMRIVWAKMIELGEFPDLRYLLGCFTDERSEKMGWLAEFRRSRVFVAAETEPHAVSVAALLALTAMEGR